MTSPSQTDHAREVAAKLTKSEKIVVVDGVTWSGGQRNRLIAMGVAPETCRGVPPLARQNRWQACRYALPLTPLGEQVRRILQESAS